MWQKAFSPISLAAITNNHFNTQYALPVRTGVSCSRTRVPIRAVLGFLIALISFDARGYVSVQDNAEVLEKNQYRAIFEPQFLFSKEPGANLVGRFDAPIADHSTIRGEVGIGSAIDFHTGAYLKWSPIPDVDNQPAIAGQVGVIYSRYDGEPEVSFRFNPIASKQFESKIGYFTPYGSIPLALETRKGRAIGTAQLTVGSQFEARQLKNLHFSAEIGFDIKDSYTYVGLGLLFYFDKHQE